LIAGACQLAAYLVYIRYFLGGAIRPNPISWIMFAYGTSLMLFLEWRVGASWEVLLLPAVCAVMSIVVALMCFSKGPAAPADTVERWAFGADIGLTFGYIAMVGRVGSSAIFNAAFVVASNATTITAFIPILLSTARNPEHEKAAPWVLWTFAYGLLGITTWLSSGLSEPTLLIYPIASVVLHGAIATLALLAPKRPRTLIGEHEMAYVAKSKIQGFGIFARKAVAADGDICRLEGPVKRTSIYTETHPNWIGIGKDQWIDPQPPLDHINHSCEPNAALGAGLILRALRPIARDEEITMDYSTTEADFVWEMACTCGAPSCRKTLRSIQVAFGDDITPPHAAPEMQRIWKLAKAKRRKMRAGLSNV
jgi:hypothetical protein